MISYILTSTNIEFRIQILLRTGNFPWKDITLVFVAEIYYIFVDDGWNIITHLLYYQKITSSAYKRVSTIEFPERGILP